VLEVGTNNLGSHKDDEIAEGVRAILDELGRRQPQAKVLVLGLLPRGDRPDDPNLPPERRVRERIRDVNARLARLADDRRVYFLDVGDHLLEPDGALNRTLLSDLQPTAAGYRILAEALRPRLNQLLP